MFETLESRRLFAGGGEALVINGTSVHDSIYLTATPTSIIVTLNGVVTSYAKSWIIPSPNQYLPPKTGFLSGIQIDGGEGNDVIWSQDSVTLPETVVGGGGADSICGGSASDSLYAGYGPNMRNPIYDISTGDTVDGAGGNDVVHAANTGDNTLYGGTGNDTLLAGNGWDKLYGGDNNDLLKSNFDNCTMFGDAGNDTLTADGAYDQLHGGGGDDVITVTNGGETAAKIYGDPGNDTITAGGNDTIDGGADNDVITDTVGSATVYGGDGNDAITTSDPYPWKAYVDGGSGNDTVTTGGGNDTIVGGFGNDKLSAGNGANYLWGLDGNDTLTGGTGTDTFLGGIGADIVSFADHFLPVTITLDGLANDGTPAIPGVSPAENDYVSADIEAAAGGSADDTITGNFASNTLFGGPGNDLIHGGGAADSVFGEAGADTLFGDAGDDLLSGGADNDLLYGGMGYNLLHGGDAMDTLVSIGGGGFDWNYGDAGLDSIWMDDTEDWSDATPDEISGGQRHVVAAFENTAQMDPTAPNLADPACDPDKGAYSNNSKFNSAPLFPSTGPMLTDVNQQMLGDCWYLAVVGAIAQASPLRIRDSIVDLGDHTFAARFYRNGAPVYIRVDDDVPLDPKFSAPIYAGAGAENCIWSMMLEKAFAVEESGSPGDYEALDGGWPQDVFPKFNLTTEQFGHWYQAANLQTIAQQLALGKALVVATDHGSFDYGDKVVLDHAYTIVSVDLVAQTIKLRNPWGNDAGGPANPGSWNDGDDDGLVTLTLAEWQDECGSSYGSWV